MKRWLRICILAAPGIGGARHQRGCLLRARRISGEFGRRRYRIAKRDDGGQNQWWRGASVGESAGDECAAAPRRDADDRHRSGRRDAQLRRSGVHVRHFPELYWRRRTTSRLQCSEYRLGHAGGKTEPRRRRSRNGATAARWRPTMCWPGTGSRRPSWTWQLEASGANAPT